jgi:hypothetical protein
MAELNDALIDLIVGDLEGGKMLRAVKEDRSLDNTVQEIRKAVVDKITRPVFRNLIQAGRNSTSTVMSRMGLVLDSLKAKDDLTVEQLNACIFTLQDAVVDFSARIDELEA